VEVIEEQKIEHSPLINKKVKRERKYKPYGIPPPKILAINQKILGQVRKANYTIQTILPKLNIKTTLNSIHRPILNESFTMNIKR
jgi:hypothetical protein